MQMHRHGRVGNTGLRFIEKLTKCVIGLHEGGRAHGDLKPHNILVTGGGEDKEPPLFDVLDFAPADDGEIRTTAYAPAYGAGAQERDRFAVLKIAEQVYRLLLLEPLAWLLGIVRISPSSAGAKSRTSTREGSCLHRPPVTRMLWGF